MRSASASRPRTSRASVAGCCWRSSMVGLLLAWIWRFRPGLWHRDNVLILSASSLVAATLALKATAGRPTLPFFLPTAAIGDAPRGPARRVDRHHRHRPRRPPRRGGERRLARVHRLHLPGRDGRHHRRPAWRPAPGLPPGIARGLRRQRAGRLGLLVARGQATPARASSSSGSHRRRRRPGRASPRSARSPCWARSSGS